MRSAELNNQEFEGSRRVTCKEAVKLLISGKLRKAWFRPGKILSSIDPDSDPAFVWFVDEKEEKR